MQLKEMGGRENCTSRISRNRIYQTFVPIFAFWVEARNYRTLQNYVLSWSLVNLPPVRFRSDASIGRRSAQYRAAWQQSIGTVALSWNFNYEVGIDRCRSIQPRPPFNHRLERVEWRGEDFQPGKIFGGSWGAMAFLDWRGVPSYVGCCRYSGSSILNASANLSAMRSPAAASAGDSGVGAVYEKQQKNG